MGFLKRFSILVCVVLLSSSLFASGFEVTGVGVKAKGMGGAFRSIADDWTAAYYNPAGYALLPDNEIGGNFGFLHYRHELTPDYLFDGTYEVGVYNNQVNYNKHEILSNPSGGVAIRLPLFGESMVGISAFNIFDNNVSWFLYDLPAVYNNMLTMPADEYTVNLDVVAFQATIARTTEDQKFSYGLGLQLLRADLIYSDVVFRDNPYPEPLGVRPWDKVTEWYKSDGNGYGFGLNFGILYQLNEKTRIGLNAKLPFPITIDGESRLEFYMPYIESINGTTDSITVDNPGSYGTAGNLFVAGQRVVDTADFETEIKLPASFGAGLSYALNDNLTLSLDIEYTLWSKYEGLNFAFTNHRGLSGAADTSDFVNAFLTEDMTNPVEWADAGKVMAGISYNFKDVLTFLGGFAYDQTPVKDNKMLTPQFMDTSDKRTFSTGLIWHHSERWQFGYSFAYTSLSRLYAAELTDLDDDGSYDNFNGLYDGDVYETALSFIYRF